MKVAFYIVRIISNLILDYLQEIMPVGNREIKAEYVENFETKYKGHKAECTFFNYSDDGIPTQSKLRIFRFDLE